MIKKRQSFIYKLCTFPRKKQEQGFSIVEVMVTAIIAVIAIGALLSAMVEMLKNEQEDTARNETQQEMQNSLSFITEDLREAVFIYEDSQTVPPNTGVKHNIFNFIPNFGVKNVPIFAFWKSEIIPEDRLPTAKYCNDLPTTDPKKSECSTLRITRRSYSLVVYLQSTEDTPPPNNKWNGKSRILRYELPQYDDPKTLTQSVGFVPPNTGGDSGAVNFPSWPINALGANQQLSLPTLKNYPVLVDYVDDPANSDPKITSLVPSCPTVDADSDGVNDYARFPTNASTSNSFFACIRRVGDSLGANQDVVLYLRGNAKGKSGITQDNYLPVLQTRVALRGVLDKSR